MVILRRILFVATFIVVASGMVAPSAYGTEDSEPEEWIFSVVLPPKWSITDAIFAYQFKGAYYLPIAELGEAYEFFVDAETDRAFVSGFAGREENTFAIDGEKNELIIKGESTALPVDSLIPQELVFEDDIYVRLDIINRVWPVEMVIDLSQLRIIAEAEEEISIVRRKERELRKATVEAQKKTYEASLKKYPEKENDYQWFGKPVIDIQSTYNYDNKNKVLTGTNTFSGKQQLGKFTASYSGTYRHLEGKLRRPGSIRANFLRQAVGDDSLFIPTLKRLEFGDISLGQRDLIGNNAGGRGVAFSNANSIRTNEFDRITIEGTGPPGWELELYNNNQIITFGVIEEDGEYRFEDVVLNFGNNRIRVIMYGPQGQIREVVEEHTAAGSLLSPGDFRYRGGVVDTNRSFIQLENDPRTSARLVTQNAEASYGLNRWLTLFGSYTKAPFGNTTDGRDVQEQYVTAGGAFQTPLGFGEAEIYKQINGGKAYDMRFITQLLGLSLNMRGAYYDEFESQEAGTKRFETEVQANTRVKLPFIPMTLRVNAEHIEFRDGNVSTEVGTQQSFTGGGLRFNHNTTSRFLNEVHETSTGGFGVNWSRGDWQTRGTFNYNIHPEWELNNGNAELRYKNDNNFQAALNTNHNFLNSTTTIGTQVGYDFNDILSTFDAQYRRERGWTFTLRASTSLNPYNADNSYKLSSQAKTGVSPVLGRVFLDHDGDGTFSEGDEPLEGARLKIDRGRSRDQTDEDGYVVASMREFRRSSVAVDEASLIDPYFKPSVEGYSTVGLKGTMPTLDFPIVETGAIDGTVWYDPSGNPVPGMRLQLIDESGAVAMSTSTAFDGYYAFEFVLPGTYTVQADPTYKVNVPAETVTVSSEELFAFGIDLYLLEPAVEESAAEQADGESGGIAQTYHAPAAPGTSQPAPLSPQDWGSSSVPEETSDEDRTPIVESPKDQSSSLILEDTSSGGAPSLVKDVRIGEHPDKVRVVLDLAGMTDYRIEQSEEGLIALIDLPHVSWAAPKSKELKYSMVMKGYNTEPLPSGGMRVILTAAEAMSVKAHRLLPASGSMEERLVIDFERKE